MVQIATSDIQTATAYSNQRKIDRCQNGVLWTGFISSVDSRRYSFAYSLDDGATWSAPTGFAAVAATINYTADFSFFIDLDDYCHVAYRDANDGKIYYRRGTPNAERTAWTWSSTSTVFTYGGAQPSCPDVVAHREGTGWVVHIVMGALNNGSQAHALYSQIVLNSAGAITTGPTRAGLPNSYYGMSTAGELNSVHTGAAATTYPSIDFNHTGDGKTVAGSTPHLYVAWSAGSTGAGFGIRFKKATYSGGSWSWGTEREIDSTRYGTAASGYEWHLCMFDGTRVLIVGELYRNGTNDLVIYERDVADTTTTTRVLRTPYVNSEVLFYGSATYDGEGNIYLFGRNHDEAAGTYDLVYRKWARSTTTLGSEVVIDSGVGNPYVSAKRGYSNNRIEFIYTDGTSSPYTITYDYISLNSVPNTPTNLAVTSDNLDTTPAFSASISDPDASQQIKGRFQIYQSDGTTLVGTIDSAFRTGAGTVTAEYASALPVGAYKVQVATVDDVGAISAYSAQVTFYVKTTVSTDDQYIWDVGALVSKDLSVQWDVLQANTKDLTFNWNVYIKAEDTDLTVEWGIHTPWTPVVPDEANNPVTWEKVSP